MAANSPSLIDPESLHTNLTEVFLEADGDGLSNLSTRYPHPPIVRHDGLSVRDVTHSLHADYFNRHLNEAFFGVFAPHSSNRPNFYEERRQKRLYFLQAHQAFFELTVDNSIYVVGNAKFHGPHSLTKKFGGAEDLGEADEDRTDRFLICDDEGMIKSTDTGIALAQGVVINLAA